MSGAIPGPRLPRRLTRALHRAHRGMTLLEIMIVLAILALVMGLLIGPRVMDALRKAHERVARLTVNKYVNEAYPPWALAYPGKPCPDKLDELNEFMNSKDTKDPWGNSYKLYCGSNLPPAAQRLAVSSLGEDGKENTADDIKSWE